MKDNKWQEITHLDNLSFLIIFYFFMLPIFFRCLAVLLFCATTTLVNSITIYAGDNALDRNEREKLVNDMKINVTRILSDANIISFLHNHEIIDPEIIEKFKNIENALLSILDLMDPYLDPNCTENALPDFESLTSIPLEKVGDFIFKEYIMASTLTSSTLNSSTLTSSTSLTSCRIQTPIKDENLYYRWPLETIMSLFMSRVGHYFDAGKAIVILKHKDNFMKLLIFTLVEHKQIFKDSPSTIFALAKEVSNVWFDKLRVDLEIGSVTGMNGHLKISQYTNSLILFIIKFVQENSLPNTMTTEIFDKILYSLTNFLVPLAEPWAGKDYPLLMSHALEDFYEAMDSSGWMIQVWQQEMFDEVIEFNQQILYARRRVKKFSRYLTRKFAADVLHQISQGYLSFSLLSLSSLCRMADFVRSHHESELLRNQRQLTTATATTNTSRKTILLSLDWHVTVRMEQSLFDFTGFMVFALQIMIDQGILDVTMFGKEYGWTWEMLVSALDYIVSQFRIRKEPSLNLDDLKEFWANLLRDKVFVRLHRKILVHKNYDFDDILENVCLECMLKIFKIDHKQAIKRD